MSFQRIRKVLQQTGLNFDLATILEVGTFLSEQIGPSWMSKAQYFIFGGTAIVCECRQIPSVTDNLVGNGIRLENIMRNLGKLSKEEFLNTLEKCVQKWKQAPHWLRYKITLLKLLYRIFDKFNTSFRVITSLAKIDSEITLKLRNLVWVLFLLMKIDNNNDSNSIMENLRILKVLFNVLFDGLITNLNFEDLCTIWIENFKQFQPLNETTETYYHLKLHNILSQCYIARYPHTQFDLHKVFKNKHLIQRLTDDLINNYYHKYQHPNIHSIDEVSFLEVQKTLPPEPIKTSKKMQPISRALDFSKQIPDQVMEAQDNSSIKLKFEQINNLQPPGAINQIAINNTISPFRKISSLETTPVTSKLYSMDWVSNCIQAVGQKQYEIFITTFTKYQPSKNYEKFKEQVESIIKEVIEQFSPNCIDKMKRLKNINQLYIYICVKVKQYHNQEEVKEIFTKIQFLKSILCLSINLYNFSYYHMNHYKRYCQMCNLSPLDSFKPINWLGKKLNLPQTLYNNLFNLQKQILIHSIWQSNTGYLVISNSDQKHSVTTTHYTVLMRLLKHINKRVTQLANKLQFDQPSLQKIIKLVNLIIQLKPNLLKNNKLDQIIICCTNFYLKQIPRHFQNPNTLYYVFSAYGQLSLSYQSLKSQLINSQSTQVNISDFYNQDFLKSVQQIFDDNSDSDKLLSTPLKMAKRMRELSDKPIPSIKQQFREGQLSSQLLNNRLPAHRLSSNSYVKKMAYSYLIKERSNEKIPKKIRKTQLKSCH